MATKAIALKKETLAACAKVSVSGKKFFELPIEGRIYTRETHCSILAHLAMEFFAGDDETRKAFMKFLIDESNSTESSNFKKRLVALEMLPKEAAETTQMD